MLHALDGQIHLLHAAVFQLAVEVAAAGAQIGAGQTHKGQAGAVGAAADGHGDRLNAGAAHGLHGVVHQMPVGADLVSHVLIGILDGQGDGTFAVLAVQEGGCRLSVGLLLFQLGGVVVTEDVVHPGVFHVALHIGQVEETVVFLGELGLLLGGQQVLELHADGQGVLHLVLGRAGMDVLAADVHLEGGGVEVFILQLAVSAAVQSVGEVGAETGHIEQVCAPTDLLVGGKGHLYRAVFEIGMAQQLLAQGEDLGNAGLIVGAQQGGAVGDHQTLALAAGQLGELNRGEDGTAAFQHQVAAVVIFYNAGLDVGRGHIVHHVHVGNKAQNGTGIAVDIAGDGAVQITVFVQPDVLQAQLMHFLLQNAGKDQLLFGAGAGLGSAVGGGVVFHIIQQTFIGAHGSSSFIIAVPAYPGKASGSPEWYSGWRFCCLTGKAGYRTQIPRW